MDELKTEYTLLFNGITETINHLEGTIKRLTLLQRAAEETYLERTEEFVAAATLAAEPESGREFNMDRMERSLISQ